MSVKRKPEGLERRWLDKLADKLEAAMATLKIKNLVALHRSGPGAVAILERGLSNEEAHKIIEAIRAALPGLGTLVVLPDNGRADE